MLRLSNRNDTTDKEHRATLYRKLSVLLLGLLFLAGSLARAEMPKGLYHMC
jgi:hypothetical protein